MAMLKGKRVAILIGPQFHDEEATSPRTFLQEQGVAVDLVGLDRSELTGKYGRITLLPDRTIEEISVDQYDGIIIPGVHPVLEGIDQPAELDADLRLA